MAVKTCVFLSKIRSRGHGLAMGFSAFAPKKMAAAMGKKTRVNGLHNMAPRPSRGPPDDRTEPPLGEDSDPRRNPEP